MKPNEIIRDRRQSLGITLNDVAQQAGLTIAAYRDIESYEDEAYTQAPLRSLRAICQALKIDLLALFNLDSSASVPHSGLCLRSKLIAEHRERLGLSQSELGDLIGFESYVVAQFENDPDYLEGWPLELIVDLSARLKMPVGALLGPNT